MLRGCLERNVGQRWTIERVDEEGWMVDEDGDGDDEMNAPEQVGEVKDKEGEMKDQTIMDSSVVEMRMSIEVMKQDQSNDANSVDVNMDVNSKAQAQAQAQTRAPWTSVQERERSPSLVRGRPPRAITSPSFALPTWSSPQAQLSVTTAAGASLSPPPLTTSRSYSTGSDSHSRSPSSSLPPRTPSSSPMTRRGRARQIRPTSVSRNESNDSVGGRGDRSMSIEHPLLRRGRGSNSQSKSKVRGGDDGVSTNMDLSIEEEDLDLGDLVDRNEFGCKTDGVGHRHAHAHGVLDLDANADRHALPSVGVSTELARGRPVRVGSGIRIGGSVPPLPLSMPAGLGAFGVKLGGGGLHGQAIEGRSVGGSASGVAGRTRSEVRL
jgi:hypothetical protein